MTESPRQIFLIPELNFWMIKTLKSSPVNPNYHKIPSDISDFWRESRSVLELLFNENFNPESTPSSSSGSITDMESINDKPYIYKYRKCNLLLIPDKNVLRRTQMYRWNALIFAASSNKFATMFDMSNTHFDQSPNPTQPPTNPVDASWLDENQVTMRLPTDVNEADRSPYITYKSNIYTPGSYPLVDMDQNAPVNPLPPSVIYPPPEDPFQFSEQDFMMLDILYDYKLGYPVTLNGIVFPDLTCIAKLIYIYLDAFLNNSFVYYSDDQTISDGSNILCTLFEKHVINMIYHLKQRQYGVIWKDQYVISDRIVEINVNDFLIMKKETKRITITEEMFVNNEILITENIPWDRRDFVIYQDGVVIEQDKDYTVVIDFSDPNKPIAHVHFITDIFLPGDILELIWSHIDPYSPISQPDE